MTACAKQAKSQRQPGTAYVPLRSYFCPLWPCGKNAKASLLPLHAQRPRAGSQTLALAEVFTPWKLVMFRIGASFIVLWILLSDEKALRSMLCLYTEWKDCKNILTRKLCLKRVF